MFHKQKPNNEVTNMKKISYTNLCKMFNVTDKKVKELLALGHDDNTVVDVIINEINPNCKLTATELGRIWESLYWVKENENPKYMVLKTIAADLFMYRVKNGETFTK